MTPIGLCLRLLCTSTLATLFFAFMAQPHGNRRFEEGAQQLCGLSLIAAMCSLIALIWVL